MNLICSIAIKVANQERRRQNFTVKKNVVPFEKWSREGPLLFAHLKNLFVNKETKILYFDKILDLTLFMAPSMQNKFVHQMLHEK